MTPNFIPFLKKAFAGELVSQDPDDEHAAALLVRIRTKRKAAAINHYKNLPVHC